MPRGRKKKFKLSRVLKTETIKSIFAVLFLLSSGLVFISYISPDYALNSKIQGIVKGLFGFPSFLILFILLLMGLLLIDSIKFSYKSPRVLLGLIGTLFSSSGLFHIFYSAKEAVLVAERGGGGGMVGYMLSSFLRNSVSVYGGVLILLALFVLAIIFLFDVSLDQILETSKRAVFAFKGNSAEGRGQGDDASLTVSSGLETMVSRSHDDEEERREREQLKQTRPEPTIEIIPSMSEPQSRRGGEMEPEGTPLVSLAPGLPYTDKVWENPPLDLLSEAPDTPVDRGDVKGREKVIIDTLKSFGINVRIADVQYGPSVTQYSLEAETGTKISKITSLQYDLALALESPTGSIRIEAPIPGKAYIGIEVPNNTRVNVNFKSLLTSDPMKGMKSKLGVVLGKDVGGNAVVYDIAKMPHCLVAGATNSGKSVFLHSIIFSILYRANPNEVKLILIDPKRTELIHYQDIPHLKCPVITDVSQAPSAFKWAVNEMERRYKMFEAAKARNIETYNEMSGFQAMPYVIILVDELAEIMIVDPASVEKSIIRIAQLARATGIHLVLAVQRPSTNIITGLIKANIPSRVAFNVASQIDSRVIIDQPGAEKLLGKGDMLFVPPDAPKPTRIQGAFVQDREISQLVNFLKSQGVEPDYDDKILETPVHTDPNHMGGSGGENSDDRYDEAVEVVTSMGKASASLLQRRLSVGYARAAKLLDILESKGVIGPANGSKPREVFVRNTEYENHPAFEDPIPEEF